MSVKVLEKNLWHEFLVFSMNNFSLLFEEFKHTMQALVEMGYILSLKRSHRIVPHFKFHHEGIDDVVPALVLTLDDLSIGFIVCLIPLILAVLAFIFELLMPIMKTFVNRIRDNSSFC